MDKNSTIVEITAELEKKILRLFNKFPSVFSAYIFGSTVQGTAKIASDVDIAVRIDNNLKSEQAFDLRLQLIDELENHFGKKVDVVVLNSASLKLINQVLRNGTSIFAKDLKVETDYVVQKQKEYFDFQYYIKKDIDQLRTFFKH